MALPPPDPTPRPFAGCPLLGIALVVGSSRGHHIVAHYPPNPPTPAALASHAHHHRLHHGHTAYKALATAPLHGSAPLALAKESLATPLAALVSDMPSYGGPPLLVPPISKRGSIAFAGNSGMTADAKGAGGAAAGAHGLATLPPATKPGGGGVPADRSTSRPNTTATTTSVPLTTTSTTTTDHAAKAPPGAASGASSSSASSSHPPTTLLGFELPLLADLLAPKPACCDTPFELTVGNVQFLGLPVGLTGAKLAPVCGRYPGMAPYYKHRMARYMRDEDTDDDLNEKDGLAATEGGVSPNTSSSSMVNGHVVYNSSDEDNGPEVAEQGGRGGDRRGSVRKSRHKKRSSFGGSMAFALQQQQQPPQQQVCSTDSDWDGAVYTTGDDDGNDTDDVDASERPSSGGRVHFSPPWKGSPAGGNRRLSVPVSTAPNTPALKSVDLALDSDLDDPTGTAVFSGGLARSKSHPGQYRKGTTPRRRSDGSAPPNTSYYDDSQATSRRQSAMVGPNADPSAGLPLQGGSSSSARLHINMFHLVFILADLGPGSREWAESLYMHVAVPLTWALRHEQLRHEFVAREAAIALRDRSNPGGGGMVGDQRHSGASTHDQLPSHSRDQSASSYQYHSSRPLSSSSARCELSHLLTQTYAAILADAPAHLLVNNHIHVTIQVPPRRVPVADSVLVTDDLGPDVDFGATAASSDFPMFGDPLPWDLARPRPTPGLFSNLPWDSLEPDPVALSADPGGASRPGHFPLIRSYHSLAFVGDRDAILARLPPDASPLVADFVRWFKPSVSFTEAHIFFQVPLYQLLRVAAHLIFWGMARLIHPISLRSVVAVDPKCDMLQLSIAASHPDVSPLARDFHTQFPGLDLIDFIVQLTTGPPRFLSSHVPSRDLRPTYQDAVAFLVARGILTQLHTYVLLKVPAILVRMPHLSLSDFEQLCGAEGSSAVLGATTGASGAQGMPRPEQIKCTLPATIPWGDMPLGVREWVRLVAATQPQGNLAAVFERVAPYFTGRFHTDEIMYRTGTVRKDLKGVLAAYAGEVVTVMHA